MSKSARKREQLALQVLGERLISLEPSELDEFPLDESLREAVLQAQDMTSYSALRRQRQLIGKLMRQADAAAIRDALEASQRQDRVAKSIFREAESWRDRIADEGSSALDEFTAVAGESGMRLEKLRQELDAARSETARRSIRRQMFREVHAALTMARDTGDR